MENEKFVEIWMLTMWNGSVPMGGGFAGWNEEQANELLRRNEELQEKEENSDWRFGISVSCAAQIPLDMFLARAKELEA